jgi:uncharacterized membrane-anchored protein
LNISNLRPLGFTFRRTLPNCGRQRATILRAKFLQAGEHPMADTNLQTASKVPEVTLVFWIIKIAATTLGETGGDTVTMTLNWGYLAGTALFLSLLVILVVLQIAAKKFHPLLYWATIIASTTAGTTMADFADRSLGIGYAGGSLLLLACVIATLGATVGDFLDKPVSDGGLALSRPIATAVIGVFIIACIIMLPQRAGQHPGRLETAA